MGFWEFHSLETRKTNKIEFDNEIFIFIEITDTSLITKHSHYQKNDNADARKKYSILVMGVIFSYPRDTHA